MSDMSLSEFKARSEQLTTNRRELQAIIAKDGATLIAKAFQEVLVDCPDGVVFWRQGTPSFNDGDPCRFTVHDLWICPNDPDLDYGEDVAIDGVTGRRYDDESDEDIYATSEQQNKLYEVWSLFDSFILENSFGESKVTISVDSVSVEEFDRY